MAIRDDVIKALQDLPDDATADDIADRVYFVIMIEQRLADLDAGKEVSDDDARKQLKQWLE
jgi:hypothetical protein